MRYGFLLLLAVSLSAQTDIASKSRMASEALKSREYERAITLYRELINALPGEPRLVMNLGLALHSAGRYKEAIQHFRTVVEAMPKLAPAWFLMGVDYLKLGQPQRALAPLQQAFALDPENSNIRLELANALFETQQYHEAAEHFDALTKAEPGNTRGWLGLGLSYVYMAQAAFERLESLDTESPYHGLLVARSLADRKQFRTAFAYYRQALEKDPTLPGVHEAIAKIYRETGHPEWAELEQQKDKGRAFWDCEQKPEACLFGDQKFRQVLDSTQGNDHSAVLYWRARACAELAQLAHQKLANLPPSSELHQLIAATFDLRSRHSEAAREWRLALESRPNDVALERRLLKSLWAAGDYETLIPQARDLIKRPPDTAETRFLLGDSLLQLQRLDEAVAQLTRAFELGPHHLMTRSSLARAYLQSGQPEKAIPHFEAALPLDDDGSVHYQLARAYQAAGQQEQARRMLAEYQRTRKRALEQRKQLEEAREITAP